MTIAEYSTELTGTHYVNVYPAWMGGHRADQPMAVFSVSLAANGSVRMRVMACSIACASAGKGRGCDVNIHPRFEPIRYLSICTGGGGLDLGLELAISRSRPVAYVEREAFACAHLVAAMEQGLLAPAPVWSDARTFPGRRFRGRVDCVIGGMALSLWRARMLSELSALPLPGDMAPIQPDLFGRWRD